MDSRHFPAGRKGVIAYALTDLQLQSLLYTSKQSTATDISVRGVRVFNIIKIIVVSLDSMFDLFMVSKS